MMKLKKWIMIVFSIGLFSSCGEVKNTKVDKDSATVGKRVALKENEFLTEAEIEILKTNCQNLKSFENYTLQNDVDRNVVFRFKNTFQACGNTKDSEKVVRTLNLKLQKLSDKFFSYFSTDQTTSFYFKDFQGFHQGLVSAYCAKYDELNSAGGGGTTTNPTISLDPSSSDGDKMKLPRFLKETNEKALAIEISACRENKNWDCFEVTKLKKLPEPSKLYEVMDFYKAGFIARSDAPIGQVKYLFQASATNCEDGNKDREDGEPLQTEKKWSEHRETIRP